MRSTDAVENARHAMIVCNACRYCDGYCAVFQAMKSRRIFTDADLGYLANLCHNCRNCYYACQYAPPHEFAVNVPRSLAQVRHQSYRDHAWPKPLGRLFQSNGLFVALVTVAMMAFVLALGVGSLSGELHHRPHRGPGAFYEVVPWGVMAGAAGIATGWSALAITVSVAAFWRGMGKAPAGAKLVPALRDAIRDVATLRNLGGGGHGCNDRDETFSRARRRLHHAMFYGLALCFTSTAVATLYDHVFGWPAPYPVISLPVLLGTVGGIGMTVGIAGLALLKRASDPKVSEPSVLGADYALLGQLFVVAVSGLGLLAFRETSAMGLLLLAHLGAVLSFFVTLPYSKFVHGPYRAAALLRAAMERQVTRVRSP